MAGLLFGSTAAANNKVVQDPIVHPDYGRVFVLVGERADEADDRLMPTDVALEEVLTGLNLADYRLADAVIQAIRS